MGLNAVVAGPMSVEIGHGWLWQSVRSVFPAPLVGTLATSSRISIELQ